MYHNTSGPGPERADATLNSARSIAIHRVVHAPAMKLTVSRVDSSQFQQLVVGTGPALPLNSSTYEAEALQ